VYAGIPHSFILQPLSGFSYQEESVDDGKKRFMGTHVSPSASLMLEKHAEKTKFLFIVKVNTKVIFRHSCHVPSLEALNFLQNLQTILFEFHSKKRKIKNFYRGPCFLLL
jgi:hypothetical protein